MAEERWIKREQMCKKMEGGELKIKESREEERWIKREREDKVKEKLKKLKKETYTHRHTHTKRRAEEMNWERQRKR